VEQGRPPKGMLLVFGEGHLNGGPLREASYAG
jgi:hypothetical protein